VKPVAAPLQELARPIAGHVVVIVIPGGLVPMPTLVGGLHDGLLGTGTPHCLSVLMIRPDSAGAAHEFRVVICRAARASLRVQS
jgi:hypothetical protein